MAYYCNGKQGICVCDSLCLDCVYFNNTGGHYVPTNADRIRAMTDEELAKWMCGGAMHSDSACSYCEYNKPGRYSGEHCQNKSDAEIIVEWLRQPAEVSDGKS